MGWGGDRWSQDGISRLVKGRAPRRPCPNAGFWLVQGGRSFLAGQGSARLAAHGLLVYVFLLFLFMLHCFVMFATIVIMHIIIELCFYS